VFVRTDVSDAEQVRGLMDAAMGAFGGIDVLFNNAGIGSFGETPDLSVDEWKRVIAVDLDSVFYGCKAAIPYMRVRGGGAIVNTASVSGLGGDYGFSAYNAAKGAVVNYTRTLALDHGKDNIGTNAVCPGLIDTRLARAIIANEEIQAYYREHHPMGRAGRAEEVAAAVAFLASGDASFINGAMLTVDGGLSAGTGQPNFPAYFR
jgi:meso-butanediol dehydrogenase/(S,S)-butanediol dehydrogenase/diacetyl reductase